MDEALVSVPASTPRASTNLKVDSFDDAHVDERMCTRSLRYLHLAMLTRALRENAYLQGIEIRRTIYIAIEAKLSDSMAEKF